MEPFLCIESNYWKYKNTGCFWDFYLGKKIWGKKQKLTPQILAK